MEGARKCFQETPCLQPQKALLNSPNRPTEGEGVPLTRKETGFNSGACIDFYLAWYENGTPSNGLPTWQHVYPGTRTVVSSAHHSL